jgi:hypothetical protein
MTREGAREGAKSAAAPGPKLVAQKAAREG